MLSHQENPMFTVYPNTQQAVLFGYFSYPKSDSDSFYNHYLINQKYQSKKTDFMVRTILSMCPSTKTSD